jgi:hypothetical protein
LGNEKPAVRGQRFKNKGSDDFERQTLMARPRKYKKPQEMKKAIDAYFLKVKKEMRPPTICGLTLALGFTDRHDLLNYEGYEKEFYAIIKKAKTQIEQVQTNLFEQKPFFKWFLCRGRGGFSGL